MVAKTFSILSGVSGSFEEAVYGCLSLACIVQTDGLQAADRLRKRCESVDEGLIGSEQGRRDDRDYCKHSEIVARFPVVTCESACAVIATTGSRLRVAMEKRAQLMKLALGVGTAGSCISSALPRHASPPHEHATTR
uniref:Uncharacterized protein n=1 Tax=Peronospora matthiolae TaxID=2874970 RepID=A0AAV1UQ40_9STRA